MVAPSRETKTAKIKNVMKSPTVDIVIVNLNGKHYLEKCLPSIEGYSENITYQIIIVDNGSIDGSCEWIKSHFPAAKVIQNRGNSGFSRACNQGIKASDGDYILLLNNDTEFLNDVLGVMVDFFERHSDAALVGPLIFYPDNEIQASIKHFPPVWKYVFQQFGVADLFSRKRRIYYPFGPFCLADYRKTHPVEWLSGACLMFKRELFNEIGPLEERMPFGLEDMDYAQRALSFGYKNYFVSDAKIVHYKGGTHTHEKSEETEAFVREAYKKGIIVYYKKHHSLPGYLVIRLSMLIGSFLKLITRFS